MGLLGTIGAVGGAIVGGPMGSVIGGALVGGLIGDSLDSGKKIKGSAEASAQQTSETSKYVADAQLEAAKIASEAQLETAEKARQLNIERYGEAKGYLDPYLGDARVAREQQMIEMGLAPGEAGTAYMETPGYKALQQERQAGAQQAAATSGSLYSGARLKEAADVSGATQSQFYTNYMNMLSSLGSPQVATNLASLGVGQAATMGQQDIAAQQAASGYMTAGTSAAGQALTSGARTAADYRMGGAQAEQAAFGDLLSGGASLFGGALAGGYI